MADPLSVVASLLAVATAGVQSTQSLKAAIKRYKSRDEILHRLLDRVEDTEKILSTLTQVLEDGTPQPVTHPDSSVAGLLRGPVERCSTVCREFEEVMEKFSRKSKTNILDWTKMEFRRGDINQFIEIVAEYKSTISLGLCVLTM